MTIFLLSERISLVRVSSCILLDVGKTIFFQKIFEKGTEIIVE